METLIVYFNAGVLDDVHVLILDLDCKLQLHNTSDSLILVLRWDSFVIIVLSNKIEAHLHENESGLKYQKPLEIELLKDIS